MGVVSSLWGKLPKIPDRRQPGEPAPARQILYISKIIGILNVLSTVLFCKVMKFLLLYFVLRNYIFSNIFDSNIIRNIFYISVSFFIQEKPRPLCKIA